MKRRRRIKLHAPLLTAADIDRCFAEARATRLEVEEQLRPFVWQGRAR